MYHEIYWYHQITRIYSKVGSVKDYRRRPLQKFWGSVSVEGCC